MYVCLLIALLLIVGCRKKTDHDFPYSIPDANYDNGHPLALSNIDQWQLEDELFNLTNERRVLYGKKPLLRNQALDSLARAHSAHMIIHDFYGHVNPEGDGPTERALRVIHDVPFIMWENAWIIGPGQPVQDALDAFWASPPHQEALLSDTDLVGIGFYRGVRSDGLDLIYISMEFAGLR